MVDVGDVSIQASAPGAIRVRFFGPPIVPDASYVVAGGPLPPTPSPAQQERGSKAEQTVTTDGGSVVVGGGENGEALSFAFHDAAGKRLLGTAPGGGITREDVLDTATGQRRQRVRIELLRQRLG